MDTKLLLIKESSLSKQIKECLLENNIITFFDLVERFEDLNTIIIPFQFLPSIAVFLKNVQLEISNGNVEGLKNYFLDTHICKDKCLPIEIIKGEKHKDNGILSAKELMTVFGFSVRTANCLSNMNYDSVSQILRLTFEELHSIRGMGVKSVKEVQDFQNKYNEESYELKIKNKDNNDLKDNYHNCLLSYCTIDKEDRIYKYYSENISLTVDELMIYLGFSIRTANCLTNMNYSTIGKILSLTYGELYSIRNMGNKSVKEVQSFQTNFLEKYPELNGFDETKLCYKTDRYESFLSYCSIDKVFMTNRTYNALVAAGCITLLDVRKCNLNCLNNIGEKSIFEIENILLKSKHIYSYEDFDIMKISANEDEFKTYDGYEDTIYYEYGNNTIGDIFMRFINDLEMIKRFENQKEYATFMFFYNLMNRYHINDRIKDSLQKSHIYDIQEKIYLDRGKGMTLESIAKLYGLTRERIRQIDSKVLASISKIYYALNINIFFEKEELIYPEINRTIMDGNYYRLFASRLNEIDNYRKIVIDGKSYYVSESRYVDCEATLTTFLKDKFSFDISDLDMVNYPYELKKHILEEKRYRIIGAKGVPIKKRKSYLEEYLKNKIVVDVSDENINIVLNELREEYNLDFKSNRALIARLDSISHPLGNKKYTFADNEPIMTISVREELLLYIESKKRVTAHELFRLFNGRIDNMLSPTHLYSYLKRNYSDSFLFGGTNLKIAIIGETISDSERVYEYILDKKSPVEKSDIIINLNLSTTALNNIGAQNEDIFKYGKSKLYLKSLLVIHNDDIDLINNYLKRLNEFYVKDLFGYITIKRSKIIIENYICNEYEFDSYINGIPSCNLKDFVFIKDRNKYVRNNVETGIEYESDFEI